MGNPNKYTDGLSYLLFPANYSQGTAGYNFPESTAQDIDGSLSLSFSGTRLPYSSAVAGQPIAGPYRGPSGFQSRYTSLALMTGGLFQPFTLPSFTVRANTFGAPNLRDIFGVSNVFDVEQGTKPMDGGTFLTEKFKNLRAFNSIGQVEVLDLICEGPIEGLVTGTYVYNLSGKTTGDIGYTSAIFQPFSTNYSYSTPETRSVYWNDVPITDFAGFYNFQYVSYQVTYGEKTNDHTIYNPYLNLYEFRTNYFGRQVDQNKIPLETSVTKFYNEPLFGFYKRSDNDIAFTTKTYYIYNTEISSVRINIKINSMYEQILTGANAGDVEKQILDIKFTIYRILNNGSLVILDTSKYQPFVQDYYSADTIGAGGKVQNSPVIITYTFNIRPFAENAPSFKLIPNQIGWAIDITKATMEGFSASLGTSTDVLSISEVYSDRFVYPDAALVYSKFDARYFTDIPTRTYKTRLLKVKIPINYDPNSKKYNGSWNGKFKVAWTDNPAWCFYDIITNNRYGLGKYIDSALADKWTLYEIAQYCDELVSDGSGGLEPRFSCNLYINTKEEAKKVLEDMASIFLSILYYSSGQIFVSQDSKKESIYLFNNSNVINGEFNYTDSSKKSRKTVATIRYNDKNDNYKPAIEYIEDRDAILKYGIRETQIVAFGCTSKNQARRLGKWLLLTDNLQTEVIDFNVGLEGHYLRPGDVISVYDQYRKNSSYAGRTLELTTGYAVLDLPFNFINTYAITGVNINNSIKLNLLTPTYNFNFGTELGNFYATGFSIGSSGVTGLNNSFIRKSQLQSVDIYNPQNYLTSGSGIYSDNIRINFPANTIIPEVVGAGMGAPVGNVFTKTAATAAWDAQAYSNTAYNKNMFAEAKANQTSAAIMFGLNSDPTLNAFYTSLDYAWYFAGGGALQIWESNAEIPANLGTYTTSTKLRINYDGEWITYLKDGVIMRAVPVATKNQALYFDSSFFSNGASINANYGTFALNDYLNTLSKNTTWMIDVSVTGYIAQGVNSQSNINNPLNYKYPGYYLEAYLNKPQEYKIINVTLKEDDLFNINALEYNDEKYTNIDTAALLVNKPIRPSLPNTPSLFLSGIFRNASDSYLIGTAGQHYTTNQGGINSIMYNIIPNRADNENSLYYTYVKPNSNFSSVNFTEEEFFYNAITKKELITGLSASNWISQQIPPFLTPTGVGDYFFRVFSVNEINERSSPVNANFNLTAQASTNGVIASGRNIY